MSSLEEDKKKLLDNVFLDVPNSKIKLSPGLGIDADGASSVGGVSLSGGQISGVINTPNIIGNTFAEKWFLLTRGAADVTIDLVDIGANAGDGATGWTIKVDILGTSQDGSWCGQLTYLYAYRYNTSTWTAGSANGVSVSGASANSSLTAPTFAITNITTSPVYRRRFSITAKDPYVNYLVKVSVVKRTSTSDGSFIEMQ